MTRRHAAIRSPLRATVSFAQVLGAACLLAGCGTPGQDLELKVEPAPAMASENQVGAEVGRLLSPDPDVSRGAERRLRALTGDDLQRFLAYARSLEGERDPRLLNVLDEHQALPALPTEEKLSFFLWKAARSDSSYGMTAQSRLGRMARDEPWVLIERLRRGGPDVDVLGVVLAVTKTEDAVPVLLDRYRQSTDPGSRAAAAHALGMFVGEARRPRPSGRQIDIDRDAEAVAAWYRERLEMRADAAAPEDGPQGDAR